VESGRLVFRDEDLADRSEEAMRQLREQARSHIKRLCFCSNTQVAFAAFAM
jgi:hypothetical protein